jgi:hypothetical protein
MIRNMLRLSRASVIRDIELLAKSPEWRPGRRGWSVLGVHCSVERHTYSGRAYSFDLEIFAVESEIRSDRRWSVIIVTESWRNTAEESIHAPKWLKLVKGKPNDVLKWISVHRDGRDITP